MKSLYWSLLIYDFDEVDDSKLSLEEGCSLFDPPLERYELFWEKSLDTKMILAWSRKKIVLSFRGTASLANVAADLQVTTLLAISIEHSETFHIQLRLFMPSNFQNLYACGLGPLP